jgi:hypothetical protein
MVTLCLVNGKYVPEKCSFSKIQKIGKEHEGMVFLGAGGNLHDWIEGIHKELLEENIGQDAVDDMFLGAYEVTTAGGRTDLVLIIRDTPQNLIIEKLAIWRIRWGKCSWLSDYTVNYADQYR